MKSAFCILCAAVALAPALFAAQAPSTPAGKVLDQQLAMLERELVPLAEAMPAEKFQFAPTGGEFNGVRTYAQQITHIAAVMYLVASAVLVEKSPSEMGTNENGPATLKTKDEIVAYLKAAFAYGHKAMASLTDKNLTEKVPSAFGKGTTPRLAMANVMLWHGFDHYGQMVVYARMNGIVPPASRR
jgi:hypothetical protein